MTQDYPRIEYFIIDGGSTDGSLQIIESHAERLAGWVSEPDSGQTDALNKGFQEAHGEVFAWLNSDDTLEPGAVSAAVKIMMERPELGLVYGDANYIDEKDQVRGRFPARQTDLRRLRQGYVHIPQQAAFFRGDIWRKVGPLDPGFYFAMDYDLWVRIAQIAPILYVPRLWANFRLHGDAKTITADAQCWPEMLRVHHRDGGSWFSVIYAKYWLRKLAAPLINRRRKNLWNL